MKLHLAVLFTIFLIFYGCSGSDVVKVENNHSAQIRLTTSAHSRTRIVDDDNLASEQTIISIAVFFTKPSSPFITHKYIDVGFSTAGEDKLVTIPLDAAELATKDIYVITNYGEADLESVNTLVDMTALTTPRVDKTNNLDPQKGVCMYGKTLGYDFVANAGTPARVLVERTCAKMRLNLTFPEQTDLSTDNSFVVSGAAAYTHITDDAVGFFLPSNDYFNFASPIKLVSDGTGTYTAIAYVYEATRAPVLYLYTRINGSVAQQEYKADFPIPARNHLYDLDIRVYEELARSSEDQPGNVVLEYELRVYDKNGRMVETRSWNENAER